MNEAQLRKALARLRRGDSAAFEQIYAELSAPLFTVILRITRDRGLSEDILQEVFLKLYRSPPGPSVHKPRAYLFQTARNLALDSLRRRPGEVSLDELSELPQSVSFDPGRRLDLEQALDALSPEERQLVTLHLNGGLKFRELARMTGTPLGTVLWRYRRAIDKLRTLLNGGSL